MGFSSFKSRWNGLAGHKKVALLMTAAALGVAAATPWLFEDGSVGQVISTGRNGGVRPRAKPVDSPTKTAEKPPATPPSSPLPVPGGLGELFDGKLLPSVSAPDNAGAGSTGGAGMGGSVGLKPAQFGEAKGFIAEPR